MRLLVVALALCAVVCGSSPVSARHAPATRQQLFAVVTVDPPPDGWTDISRDRENTAKDLVRHLSSPSRKWLLLAPDAARAHLVLHVVERHMEEDGELHVVTVRVTVGDVERGTVSGRAGTGWGDAARNLVMQLETWADENRDRILAARTASTH